MTPHFDPPFVPVLQRRELPSPLWQLLGQAKFWSNVVNDWVVAEQDFITDGCSIPLAALLLLVPFGITLGMAAMAGYIHDALYTSQKYPREVCDAILREMVIALGYGEELAEEFYLGVRIGGGAHWNLPNVPQLEHVEKAMNMATVPESVV